MVIKGVVYKMHEIYIVKFTTPHSPAPSFHHEYFSNMSDAESFLKASNYVHDFSNKFHSKSNVRSCAYVLSFSNSTLKKEGVINENY